MQYVQNQIYTDLDNFQLGKQYAGQTVEIPIIFDGFTPWLAGPAGPATSMLAQRYLFLSHFDINQPKPPQGMLSSQTLVVSPEAARAQDTCPHPADGPDQALGYEKGAGHAEEIRSGHADL